MLDYIKGKVVHQGDGFVVVEKGGFGFLIHTPHRFNENTDIQIYTVVVIKDETLTLYGFKSPQERELFQKLTGISGIGIKHAFSVLKTFPLEEFLSIVENQDTTRLTKASGIGRKTAQRIILELKGKINFLKERTVDDVVSALVSLGFDKDKALDVALQVAKNSKNTEEAVKLALQKITEKR
ncbi:MAG: Holliday junction branch migration protein RuvA [Aquificae bacterium]|nr:Holliday junction branch migration protein RuvA [Aquificota bacterium]